MFISVEGADYSGKTTMCGLMSEYFKKLNREVVVTREPGGTDLGTGIRNLLVNEDIDKDPIDVPTQLLLLYAARIHHVRTVILPALAREAIVISDRYIDSSLVYQGLMYGHSDFIEKLVGIKEIQYLQTRPDYTFYFDIDYDTMVQRMANRGEYNSLDEKYSRLKERPLDCFKEHFYNLQKNKLNSNQIKIVDATQDMKTVQEATIELCKDIAFGGLPKDRQYYSRVQSLLVC